MQANWSLILNVLLLVGVIATIGRLMKVRRQSLNAERYQPDLGAVVRNPYEGTSYNDDIIAVRKINTQPLLDGDSPSFKNNLASASKPQLIPDAQGTEDAATTEVEIKATPKIYLEPLEEIDSYVEDGSTLMMFLLAKEGRQFAGYELLQTVLTAGLRFGEGSLFHRHQFANGEGAVICSLAAATATGVFDLQNIGAFSVRGLCLYMNTTNNSRVNSERFLLMLDTAKQLGDGLDAHLLDEQRRLLTDERIAHYYDVLGINSEDREVIAV